MKSYSDYRKGFSKCLAEKIYTESEIFNNWVKTLPVEILKAEQEMKEISKKTEFVQNAINILGMETFEECMEAFGNPSKNLKNALESGTLNSVVKSEVEYQLSLKGDLK